MLFSADLASTTIFSATRLILCAERLCEAFQKSVTTEAMIVPYPETRIGSGTLEPLTSFKDFGIPVGLEMIVARKGCAIARELLDLLERSGFPRRVSLIEIDVAIDANSSEAQLAFLKAYQTASEVILSRSHTNARAREEEIVLLRRRAEAQAMINNHLSEFIGMLGYSSQELALEMVPDLEANFLPAPVAQSLPTVLSDIAGISIFSADAASTKSVRIGIGTKNREIFHTSLELPAAGGWHDLFFPTGFIAHNHDAVLTLEPISGAPLFAVAQGVTSSWQGLEQLPGQSLALRIWRHADPNVYPLRHTRVVELWKPDGLKGRALGTEAILSASGMSDISALVSFPANALVQTHPIENETTNYVIRDIDISETDCVEATIDLAHPDASAVRFIFGLLPEGDDNDLYHALKWWDGKSGSVPAGVFASVSVTGGKSDRLVLSTEGLDRTRRYAIVLAAEALDTPHYAWAQWKKVSLHMRARPYRQTYRFSSLAALQQQIEYADGPFVEHEINSQNGFAVISMSDGDQYLQTHPLENIVVAAKLNFFAPKGLSRLWIDVSVDHEGASPTEFGIYLTPTLDAETFTEYYRAAGLEDLEDDLVHSLPGGRHLKKSVVNPLEQKTINVDLLQPLQQACHLYIFVKSRGGTQYGWCRWHRIAMSIAAESTSFEIGNQIRQDT